MGELHGATVGFIGFGDIAQQTARLCRAFGMRLGPGTPVCWGRPGWEGFLKMERGTLPMDKEEFIASQHGA